jgi:hypothetical protein
VIELVLLASGDEALEPRSRDWTIDVGIDVNFAGATTMWAAERIVSQACGIEREAHDTIGSLMVAALTACVQAVTTHEVQF